MNNQKRNRVKIQVQENQMNPDSQLIREEFDFNLQQLEERQFEIEKIRTDSQILNEIIIDLAEMVNNQGESVKQISKQTKVAREKTESALNQIKMTKNYKENDSYCSFCYIC